VRILDSCEFKVLIVSNPKKLLFARPSKFSFKNPSSLMKVVRLTWILLKGNSFSMFYVYLMKLCTIYTYMYTHTYIDTQSSTMGKK
jgi:hypothetical protein